MHVYYTILGIFSFCVIGDCTNISSKLKNILYWSCSASLIILSSARSFSVGADTLTYCKNFEYIRELSFRQALHFRWEQGYVVVNWLLGRFFEDGRVLVVFMALTILIPFFCWIKQESEWPILSLVIFICTGMWSASMYILRQWCAMAILIYSYKYIKERRFWPFLLSVIIAMMFHRTAAVFLLAYVVFCIPLNLLTVLLTLPISMMVGLFGKKILNILNHFARISEEGNFNGGVSILIVLWLCVFATLICFGGHIPERLDFYFRFVLLAAALQPIAFTFSNWARIVTYYSVSLSVFLPNVIMELTSGTSHNRMLRVPLGVVVCLLMMIWFKMIDVDTYIFM